LRVVALRELFAGFLHVLTREMRIGGGWEAERGPGAAVPLPIADAFPWGESGLKEAVEEPETAGRRQKPRIAPVVGERGTEDLLPDAAKVRNHRGFIDDDARIRAAPDSIGGVQTPAGDRASGNQVQPVFGLIPPGCDWVEEVAKLLPCLQDHPVRGATPRDGPPSRAVRAAAEMPSVVFPNLLPHATTLNR